MSLPIDWTEERFLAVDYGTRRIGLAVGSGRDGIAVTLGTLEVGPVEEDAIRRAAEAAREEGATRLMVGLPLNMNGTEGDAARRARAFGDRLAAAAGLPVLFVDERLTSEAAREAARSASGGRRVSKPVDDLAAAILLQGWFDEEAARRARGNLEPL
jgi:putative holliday junction resolvase